MKVPISTCCIGAEPKTLIEKCKSYQYYENAPKSEKLKFYISQKEKIISSLKGRKLTEEEKNRIRKSEIDRINNDH